MVTYSISDLSRRSGDIIAEALRRPVTIVQRKKPRLVLMSFEDYRKLIVRADTRSVGTLDSMPDALFEEFRCAVDAYERDGKKQRASMTFAPVPSSAIRICSASSG